MARYPQTPHAAPPTLEETNLVEAFRLRDILIADGVFLNVRVLPDGSVAAISDLLFTRSITLGCTRDGWAMRYCFEDRALANRRFAELLSEDDVPAGSVAHRLGLARK